MRNNGTAAGAKILITGAGYIGSTLASTLLHAGYSLRVGSVMHGGAPLLGFRGSPQFEFVKGEIRDRTVTRQALSGISAVVHLAAIVGDPACARDTETARRVNFESYVALPVDSRAAGVERFVFASTCSNYGRMKDPASYVDESSDLAPLSVYAETKVVPSVSQK